MSTSRNPKLEQARQLARAGDLDAARELLTGMDAPDARELLRRIETHEKRKSHEPIVLHIRDTHKGLRSVGNWIGTASTLIGIVGSAVAVILVLAGFSPRTPGYLAPGVVSLVSSILIGLLGSGMAHLMRATADAHLQRQETLLLLTELVNAQTGRNTEVQIE